jgi:hypothetical protein
MSHDAGRLLGVEQAISEATAELSRSAGSESFRVDGANYKVRIFPAKGLSKAMVWRLRRNGDVGRKIQPSSSRWLKVIACFQHHVLSELLPSKIDAVGVRLTHQANT